MQATRKPVRASPRSRAVHELPGPQAAPVPVQRKAAGCSCGGGCPACKEDASAEREADAVAQSVLDPGFAGPPDIRGQPSAPAQVAGTPDPGPGRPLPGKARAFFEPRFGADFSAVKVHHGRRADAAAASFGARAYTTGTNVVFADGAFALGTPRGDRLMAHELTHVVQQRRRSSAVQRAPADFEITGKQSQIDDLEKFFYFEKDSTVLDATEKKKIPKMIADKGKDLILKGLRSRDEASHLAGDRAAEAEKAIKAEVPDATPLVQAEKNAFQKHPLYRLLRSVLARKNTAGNAAAICPKGAEKVKKECPDGAVKVDSLFRDAETDVLIARKFVEAAQADPAKFPHVAPKLEKYFGKGHDTARIISDLKKVQTHIATIAARDMGRKDRRPGYRCATICLSDCQTAVAFSTSIGSDNRVTLCPKTWEKPESRTEAVSTIVHEATHGTSGIGKGGQGTDDVVYAGEKVLRFLSTDEALNSADVIAYFVEDMVHGGKDKISPKTTDDVSAIKDKKKARKAEEGLARLAKWLAISTSELIDVHAAAAKAKGSGWDNSFERSIMKEVAKHFSVRKPPKRPREADVRNVAGLADRVYLMATVATKHKITVQPESWLTMPAMDPAKPVLWTHQKAPDPARMPGLVVKVDPDLFGMLGVGDGEIRAMLEAMAKATPSIPAGHVQGYVEVIDMIRRAKNVGP